MAIHLYTNKPIHIQIRQINTVKYDDNREITNTYENLQIVFVISQL
jgi:hypothetical protein